MSNEIKLVNLVGSGRIPVEVDLAALRDDLPVETAYIKGPGLYFKFHEDGPVVVVARSGKYIITGADSDSELEEVRQQALELFTELGLIELASDVEFSIKNRVFTAELSQEINLDTLAILVGFERMEYEPEQFPALIYRPESIDTVVLIFSSGKIVITGITETDVAEAAFDHVTDLIGELNANHPE